MRKRLRIERNRRVNIEEGKGKREKNKIRRTQIGLRV